MNPITVKCPGCQSTLRVNAGTQPTPVKCPTCQTIFSVPATSSPASPSQAQTSAAQSDNLFADLPPVPSTPPTNTFPTSGFPETPAPQPYPTSSPPPPPAGAAPNRSHGNQKKGLSVWVIFAIASVVVLGAPMLCCGVIGLIGLSQANKSAEPVAVMSEGLQAIPVPTSFPDLGPATATLAGNVTVHRVVVNGTPGVPGSRMKMRIYIPPGEHADGSLGCVLVAPAGTPLIHGADVDDGDYHDETLPYAQAGYVVIHYSISGIIPSSVNENDDQAFNKAIGTAWPQFRESGGGIANGRNALEYALAKIKAVDPNRIAVAGHSSAGTLALMLAAHEPRINTCIAYAPAYDTEKRMAEAVDDPFTRILLPGIKDFVRWYTPMNYTDDFQCRLMICHAPDDDNVPFADYERFIAKLVERRYNGLMMMEKARGGHYAPMIREWIPQAVLFLRGMGADTK